MLFSPVISPIILICPKGQWDTQKEIYGSPIWTGFLYGMIVNELK